VVKDPATLAAMRDRLLALSPTALVDALGRRGAVDSTIRLLTGQRLAGPAVTASCEPGSVAAMFRALRTAGERAVLCVRGEGECAYFGELAGAEAVRRGLAGVVVDGLVRDMPGLRRLGLTVFARGTIAVGGVPAGGGRFGEPIEIGSQRVRPGDWLAGDADGLVVIPAEDLETAVRAAEQAAEAEAETLRRIAAGSSLFDLAYRGGGGTLGKRLDG
jgi:regulator of RNase E activity RraA